MAINTSLASLTDRDFGYAQAQHLLARAGFGGTPQEIRKLQALGVEKAVASLVDFESIDAAALPAGEFAADILRPATTEEKAEYLRARRENDEAALAALQTERVKRENEDRRQMRQLEHWWLKRIIESPRPLEEKLTLLWHGHFASNHRTVRDSYHMFMQNALFRQHAAGNFANLATGIIHDPAMIKFLDNDSNRRRRPNENLARELMELFTLGEGHYSEDDIKQGARALTGYTFNDDAFVFDAKQHDGDEKTLFGQKGKYDGDGFVKLLLARPACAEFVAFKLYRHFVADVASSKLLAPPQGVVVKRLADMLRVSGYELKPVLKSFFASRHFYDDSVMGNMIKSPVQLAAGTIRALRTPVRNMDTLSNAMGLMGQRLFDPPTVAGWDGGPAWINSSTLFVRQNLCVYLLTGVQPGRKDKEKSAYDPKFLTAGLPAQSPPSVVDHLMVTLLGAQRLPRRREQMLTFINERGGMKDDSVLALLLLITAMPEYQLG